MAFRKTFTLNGVPASALAHIAVDSKYWLWINGKLVVREGALKRGPTPNDTYFDEVNLAPYLLPGVNTVAVLVDYWGQGGFSSRDSGQGGPAVPVRRPWPRFGLILEAAGASGI